MSERDPVIIVGAGPAGLAVAAILAQAGVASRVFEAEEKLPRDLRAGSIHPPTLEMLDTIGVAQDFLAIGIVVPRWQIRGREEGVIVEWDLSLLQGETPYPFRFHCEQFKLTPLLKARLESLGGSVNFVKFVLENSVYVGLPGATVLALSGRLSSSKGLHPSHQRHPRLPPRRRRRNSPGQHQHTRIPDGL